MKNRFTEEQIIGFLREADGGSQRRAQRSGAVDSPRSFGK
jgi:hypothetical protein